MGYPLQGPVCLHARLGSKGKNSDPSSGRAWDYKNHNPRGLPYKPLACSSYITNLPRSPVILDSFALWYNNWLKQPQQLSRAKQPQI